MFIRHFLYGLLGLFLLPAAMGLGQTFYQLLVEAQTDPVAGATLARFLIGVAVWLVLFFVLPRPVRGYVLAHEFSHALAAWISGEKVSRLRVGKHGGSVLVSNPTLFIALAPYMLPFYSLLLLLGTAIAGLWLDLSAWIPWMPFLLGLTWSFHLSFTILSLALGQSDIHPFGPVCAYPVIFTGNLLILLPAIAWIAPVSLETWLQLTAGNLAAAYLDPIRQFF